MKDKLNKLLNEFVKANLINRCEEIAAFNQEVMIDKGFKIITIAGSLEIESTLGITSILRNNGSKGHYWNLLLIKDEIYLMDLSAFLQSYNIKNNIFTICPNPIFEKISNSNNTFNLQNPIVILNGNTKLTYTSTGQAYSLLGSIIQELNGLTITEIGDDIFK